MNNDNGSIDFEARLRLEKLEEGVKEMEKMLNDSMKSSQKETDKLQQSINNLAKGAMAFFTLSQAKAFVSQVIEVRSQFQQLEISFGTMLKSKEKANALMAQMAQMADLASKTPFGLEEVSEGAKRLLAFQVPAQEVTETLRRMGDVAAGLGVPMGQLIHVYGQVKAQGKLMTNDLYQFMNAGIPIIAELSKVVGKSETEIKDMVSAGKIGFPEVQAVIKNMTNEGGLFFNLMAEQSKSLGGQISNLGDSFDQMLNEIGKASEGYISGAIQGVSFLVENYQTLGKVIAGLIATYGIYRTAVLVNIALTKGWSIATKEDAIAKGIQTAATKAQTIATAALNTVMKANPYVLVASAVVALGFAMWALKDNTDANTRATERHNKLREEQAGIIDKQKKNINDLISVVQDETKTWEQRNTAFLMLKSTMKGVFDQYTSLNDLLRNMAKALKDVNGEFAVMDESMSRDAVNKTEKGIKAKEAEIKRLEELQKKVDSTAALGIQRSIDNLKSQIKEDNILKGKQEKVVVGFDVNNFANSLNGMSASQLEETKQKIYEAFNRKKSVSTKNQWKFTDANNPFLNYSLEDLGRFNQAYKEHIKMIEQEKTKTTDVIALRKEILTLEKEIEAIEKRNKNSKSVSDKAQKELDEKRASLETKKKEYKGLTGDDLKAKSSSKSKSERPTFDQEAHLLQTQRITIDNELAEQKKGIDALKDGYDKELALIHYFYDEKAEAIRRGGEDARIALEKERTNSKGLMSNETYNARLNAINENEIIANEQNSTLKIQQEQKLFDGLLEKYQNYFQKRKSLVEKQERDLIELGKILSNEQLEELKKQQQAELDELDDAYISKNDNYKKLFEDLRELSNKEIEEAIKKAKELLSVTNMSEEMRKSINARIKDTERMFSQKKLSEINQYSQAVRELSKAFSELGSSTGNSSLSSLSAVIGNLAGQFTGLMEVMNRYKNGNISSADKFGAVAGFASNLISSIADSARQRKDAEEQYYTSVISYQNAYNLALIEQKRIQKELDSSFLLKDRTEQLKTEFDAIRKVGDEQQKQLEQIRQRGQVKVGTENRTDWGGVAGMTASGAITGAMMGAGPVGAVVGAVAGFIGGLFSSKKPKDVFGNLLQTYPNLLEQSANGVWKINKAQAENVKNSGLVNEETKLMLQQYIDLENELEKSRTKIKEIVTEFAGNLAPNIQNSLVEAFKAGEDAIVKMGETMDKVVENMVSSLIFQSIFKDTFKKLEDEMQKSKDVGGDGNWVDDFGRFYREAGAKTKQYYEALTQARDSAKAEGFNILQDNAQRHAVEKGFARMSQDSADELNGQFRLQTQLSAEIKNAMLQSVKEFTEMHKFMQTSSAQQLRHLAGIEANTYKLNKMEIDLAGVKTILGNIETKGIKMRT